MKLANKLIPAGKGLAPVLVKRADTVQLSWDMRQKSRFDCDTVSGQRLGVFTPRGSVIRGGDVLVCEDGGLVRVEAAPQAVLRVTHCTAHGTPFDLLRAAYHLGNRHVQLELTPTHLQLEPNPVLADMLRGMHLIVTEHNTAFEPEAGAYAGGHGHGHGPDQAEHHAHEHSPVAARKPIMMVAAAPAPHVHGPHCNHDHDHSHDHSHHGHKH
jgi:urease accessory protein